MNSQDMSDGGGYRHNTSMGGKNSFDHGDANRASHDSKYKIGKSNARSRNQIIDINYKNSFMNHSGDRSAKGSFVQSDGVANNKKLAKSMTNT